MIAENNSNMVESGSSGKLKLALIIGVVLTVLVIVIIRFMRRDADAGDEPEPEPEPEPEEEKKMDKPPPEGSEPGIGGGNLIEIKGANNHDACMAKAKEANYAGFAMKKDDDGKFTRCFGYTAEMSYPFTKELDTSYTACSDPAMEVANSCAASMEDGGVVDPPEINIEYPEDPKYVLAPGKGIEEPLDSASANYTNFAKDVNQCLQECNEDDIGCTGIQFTGEGECIILDQTATFPTPNEYVDNENGALYKKIIAPPGYRVDNPGKDYASRPIMTLRDVDVKQCKEKCDADKSCVGFSMYNSGKCQPKTKEALSRRLITRPGGSTFYTKNVMLIKPIKWPSSKPQAIKWPSSKPQVIKWPSSKTQVIKNAELMKPMKRATDGPASATDVIVQTPEPAPVPSNRETYVPEWLNAKKKPKGKFLG